LNLSRKVNGRRVFHPGLHSERRVSVKNCFQTKPPTWTGFPALVFSRSRACSHAPARGRRPGSVLLCPLAGASGAGLCRRPFFFFTPTRSPPSDTAPILLSASLCRVGTRCVFHPKGVCHGRYFNSRKFSVSILVPQLHRNSLWKYSGMAFPPTADSWGRAPTA
jgi:hypothetical protein